MDYISNFERVLAQHGEWRGNRVHFPCPFPGCVGYLKKKLSVDPQRGFWRCLHCHHVVPGKEYRAEATEPDGGTAWEFARLMGDDMALWPRGLVGSQTPDLPKLTTAQARKIWSQLIDDSSLSPEDADLMEARGIDPLQAGFVSMSEAVLERLRGEHDDEALVRAGLAYFNEAQEFRRRTCIKEGRILIPYREEKKGQVVHFVGYLRLPLRLPKYSDAEYEAVKSNWPKCAGPAGFSPPLYGVVPPDSPYLIVTEGQIKAIAAQQSGFACVGLQGMGNGHPGVVRAVLKAGCPRVILLFDTEAKDQENVEYEELRLAKAFLKAGVPCYQARLPITAEEEKVDLDDFLLKQGAAALVPVLQAAVHRPYLALPSPEPLAGTGLPAEELTTEEAGSFGR